MNFRIHEETQQTKRKGIGNKLMQSRTKKLKKDIEACKDKMILLAKYAMPYQYNEEKAKEYYAVQRKFNGLRKELNKLLDMRKTLEQE